MPDINSEIAALKQRAANAEKQKIVAEHQRQQAEKEVAELKATLLEEYGVSSPEQGKELLLRMQDDVRRELAIVESSLKNFEEST